MHDASAAVDEPRAGKREWIGLAVLGLPTILISLDIGALFLALPHLTADLGATSVEQLWITDIYGFLLAGFLITMGTLGDRIGRRRLLLIGAALFGVLSVVAAFADSPETLIVSRALLGVAGATLMPSTLALITNMFLDAKQRGTAIATWVSCMMVGAAIGPLFGGVLLEYFWWGSVFLLGVPVMLVLLVVGPVLLPESRNPDPGKLDLASVALSLLAILPIIYGLKELAASSGGGYVVPVVSIVVGAVFAVVFVRRQLHLSHPLIDIALFRGRVFRATLTSMLLAAAAMAGAFLLTSLFVQSVGDYSPAETALWLVPTGLSIAVGSQLAPWLVKRFSPGATMTAGLVLGALGFALMTFVGAADGPALAVIGIAVVHLGAGPLFALGAGVVMSSVPPERAGSAASMSETANHFGTTLGLALIGTLGTAIYRWQLAGDLPAGLSGPQAQQAQETIGGAVAVSDNLAGTPAAGELSRAAGEAFTTGLNVAVGVGAVLFAVLAAVVHAAHRAGSAAATPAPAAPSTESEPEEKVPAT